jgi:hypothetical protein
VSSAAFAFDQTLDLLSLLVPPDEHVLIVCPFPAAD